MVGCARGVVGACITTLAICSSVAVPGAWAATSYVDGISDQHLAVWDAGFSNSPFARFFESAWVGDPPSHIKYARFVAQWNDLHYGHADFEQWLRGVDSIDGGYGLTLELALTHYGACEDHAACPHEYPASPAQYGEALRSFLSLANGLGHPVAYVEPWNEPNAQGGYRRTSEAGEPTQFAVEADNICGVVGCQIVAGNVEDSPQARKYVRAYINDGAPRVDNWGIHPYRALKEHSAVGRSGLEAVRKLIQRDIPSSQLWFTEVGAYYCVHNALRGGTERTAEAQQAGDAGYLVRTLIPKFAPVHVFYYGVNNGEGRNVSCPGAEPYDSELYKGTNDQPRMAASLILGRGAPPPAGSILIPTTAFEPITGRDVFYAGLGSEI
jgi:hypothetical protein